MEQVAVEPEDELSLASHTADRRSRTIASKTGWRSVGERLITREDLRGRRLLLQRLCQLAVPRLELREQRTFSIAMTAWSAKVLSSSICLSEKGRASGRQ